MYEYKLKTDGKEHEELNQTTLYACIKFSNHKKLNKNSRLSSNTIKVTLTINYQLGLKRVIVTRQKIPRKINV